ncbi:alpha-hydroxy-acid oxidizing protein [Mycobacteroides salmoniphilum]|uniref:Lactate 2-monooxygenase n=1 Tax=Mycobacteroides salmoniphilum TaxID=404941 RepID=A0A4R8SE35_9MYCO|nr:alpha-hydroxy-acid oxidizing protein [Mycobacteroides salmoniphilum]TDZ93701.1 Lactate 2-monooxygenase [Mycobacteroides salmoniphilum]TEA09484.1 Lactate 2-monooxygenase [Mycobacteroides salmoniphilum]
MSFGDFQLQFYAAGALGKVSTLPFTFAELESRAEQTLGEGIFGYVRGGAGDEHTQDANATALRRYGLVPRMLRDRTARDMSTSFLGRELTSPLFICPVGVLGAVRDRGDLLTAAAARELDVPAMYSTLSSATLEEVAAERGDSYGIFQLYPSSDAELTDNFIRRAEAAGYDALAVTLDTGTLGWRPRDLKHGYLPMLHGHCLANYTSDPRFLEIAGVRSAAELAPMHAGLVWASLFSHPGLTWADIDRYRELTKLPIILKGICDVDDVRQAVDRGIDAVAYSNHGGRQANGGIPAIDGLAAAVQAAGSVPVTFDSGVRDGIDVLRAVALGASLVGIARPYVYGLALDGTDGVKHVIQSLLAEADLTMAVNCYLSLDELAVQRLS